MILYVGEGLRGSNGACSTLCQISVTPSTTHNQIGPLWCWFPSGRACAHSRTLWVSPMNSLMKLGVSPPATSARTGVFNYRFEALFPRAGALGCAVCFAPPPFLPVCLCANVGPWGLLAAALLSPFVPQSAMSVGLPAAALLRFLSAPAACLHPCYQSGWMFFISLVVRLPCGSIFCQFWLFLVFKLLLSFFWLCEEAQSVYLRLHLGQQPRKLLRDS